MIETVEANVDFELRFRRLLDKGQLDVLDLLIIWLRLRGYKQIEIGEMLHITYPCVKNRRIRMRTLWRKMI